MQNCPRGETGHAQWSQEAVRESQAGGGCLQPQDPHTACTAHLYPSIWLPVLGRPGPDSRDVQSRGTTGLSACLCLAKCKIDPCVRENTSVHRRDEETGREWRLEDVYLMASLSVRLMLPPTLSEFPQLSSQGDDDGHSVVCTHPPHFILAPLARPSAGDSKQWQQQGCSTS